MSIPTREEIPLFESGGDEDADFFSDTTGAMTQPWAPEPETPESVWDHWVGVFRKRLATDWDNVVVIDGPRRVGKTTLGILLMRELDPNWGLDRVVFSAADMLVSYSHLSRGSWVLYDEAVLGLLSRRASSDENVALVQAVMAGGKLGISVILCIPDMMNLDPAFRETVVQFRISCILGEHNRRGTAIMHVRSDKIRYDPSDPRRLYRSRRWNPITWPKPPLRGFWAKYRELAETKTREFSAKKAEELKVSELRKLTYKGNGHASGGGETRRFVCSKCGSEWGSSRDLRVHETRCKGGARPRALSTGPDQSTQGAST